ncbi:hypothetical protein WME90_35845 [Sorangium sp. So ce375]|uniref:hypothetical protein n=1 Tax=Sorangium sp. So ce375 TaxID=3133306 RepID=UPI003F5AF19D
MLILAPLTLGRANISITEASNSDVSGSFRTGASENDAGVFEALQPPLRDASHRSVASRAAPRAGVARPRAVLVADLRPVRIPSPVPHPPLRRPPPRFLN